MRWKHAFSESFRATAQMNRELLRKSKEENVFDQLFGQILKQVNMVFEPSLQEESLQVLDNSSS